MKKQVLIRILTLVIIITSAAFVVSAARTAKLETEECIQGESECVEAKSQSEFLLESLTRNLLGR